MFLRNLNALKSSVFFILILSSQALLAHTARMNHEGTIDPLTIPKFSNQLTVPDTFKPTIIKDSSGEKTFLYTVIAKEFQQQILPKGFPKTTVYGFGGNVIGKLFKSYSYPGPTIEALRNKSIEVQYVNNLTNRHMFAVDPTIMFANTNNMPCPNLPFIPFPPGYDQAQNNIPLAAHLHGGINPSNSDGHPLAWFTADEKLKGPEFVSSRSKYYNAQLPTTLWFHDHSLGMTRLNMYAGLAAFYIIRDKDDPIASMLPCGKYEIPLMIQDRSFNEDGSLFFTKDGDNPDIHPYWDPEFFGNTIVVNGKVWPNLDVERRQYRFRILNGSNARFYNFKLSNGASFVQIGGDGGYLPSPVTLTELLVAPAQRVDILVDFSAYEGGTKIIMQNDAAAPYPCGDPVDPETLGQIMQFTILNTKQVPPNQLPTELVFIPSLQTSLPKRLFTLNEHAEDVSGEPLDVFLDGQHFCADVTEVPLAGTTEEWFFQNLTEDAHPIHVHLAFMQLKNRQAFDVEAFSEEWQRLNGTRLPLDHPTIRLDVEDPNFQFLTDAEELPTASELGWKDTIIVPPGKVTRVLIRFAPQEAGDEELTPGINPYPFDPTIGPGYVWHCHILDHEDNDMMRPMQITVK